MYQIPNIGDYAYTFSLSANTPVNLYIPKDVKTLIFTASGPFYASSQANANTATSSITTATATATITGGITGSSSTGLNNNTETYAASIVVNGTSYSLSVEGETD